MKKQVKELLVGMYNSGSVSPLWKDEIKLVAPELFTETKLK